MGHLPRNSPRLAVQYRDKFDLVYRPGATLRELADSIGCHVRTVERIRRERGLAVGTAPGPRLTVEQIDKYRALLEDGWSYTEIANTFGHSGETISRNLPGYAMSHADRTKLGAVARKINNQLRARGIPVGAGR